MFVKTKFFDLMKSFTNIWFIVRLVLILICFGWFYMNVFQLITDYLKYKTMVMVEYKELNVTRIPAITVCAYSFISDDKLSDDYWDEWYTDSNTLKYERYHIRHELRSQTLKDKTAAEIFDDNSITFDSLVASCYFYPSSKETAAEKLACKEITTIVESLYLGRKCYTLFSRLNITKDNYTTNKMNFDFGPFIKVVLTNQSDHYFAEHLENETTILSIHSPNIIPTSIDTSYYRTLISERNQFYDLRFQKTISHLMSYPYKTMCRWYSADYPPGERSRGDCLNRCIQQFTFDKCFNYFTIVTRDMLTKGKDQNICPESESSQKAYTEARIQCNEKCHLTCIEEVIQVPYKYLFTGNVDPQIYFVIKPSTLPYAKLSHVQAIDSSDFGANLGAHAHIWLGLSALKIFHWIVYLINYMRKFFSK